MKRIWVGTHGDITYAEYFISDIDPAVLSRDDNYMGIDAWQAFVEYSAYEALQKILASHKLYEDYEYEIDRLTEQNRIMREALKSMAKGGNPECGCYYYAGDALKKCGSTEPTTAEDKK